MSLVDTFFGTGNDLDRDSLGPEALQRLQGWLDRWEAGAGPAFLPRQHGATLSWYGLMDDGPQRRELEQLLQHWVGPACSDVHRRRGALDPDDNFDAWLARELPGRVVRLDVCPSRADDARAFKKSRDAVRARVERLVAMLDRRPEHRRVHAAGLGAALDDVYLRASSGDAEGAEELIRTLERRRMLDAPNTAFVRLRVLALSGQHDAVLTSPDLADLDGQHLPTGIANLVAAAVAEAVAVGPDNPVQATRSLPRHVVRAAAQADPSNPALAPVLSLLGDEGAFSISPATKGAEGEPDQPPETEVASPQDPPAEISEPDHDQTPTGLSHGSITQVLDGARAYALWMDAEHDRLLEEFSASVDHTNDVIEWAVLAADKRGGYDAAAKVLDTLGSDSDAWSATEWRLPGAADAFARLRTRRDGSIGSWAAWFDAIESREDVPDQVLEEAVDWAPLPPSEALARIDAAGAEVLVPVLGRFLATHRETMSLQERAELSPRLLEALALSDRAGRDVRGWSYTLVSDALDGSLASPQRTDVFEALRVLLWQQMNKGTIGWALDVVGETVDAWQGVARNECVKLLTEMIEHLRDCRSSITIGDIRALDLILDPFDMSVPGDLTAHLADEASDPLACHAGKSILIYSLRERSARQAAARLALLPGTTVTLAHDKVGSTKLAGQVTGSDLVVIVTAAAKHAATEFIQERIAGDSILVNSAGASALIRELTQACT